MYVSESAPFADKFEYLDSPLNHGWSILSTSVGGSLATVYDSTLKSRVLEIKTSAGTEFEVGKSGLTKLFRHFAMRIEANSHFIVYVMCLDSTSRMFFLEYDFDIDSTSIHVLNIRRRLGATCADRRWHLFQRDIYADLAEAGSQSFPARIAGVLISGAARIDDIEIDSSTEDITTSNEVISGYALLDNYPNPFNPETKVEYELQNRSHVQLEIYDILSQEVKTLVDQVEEAGIWSITWDGKNNNGAEVASGVYFYRLNVYDIDNLSNVFKQTKKMLLIR
jgi:hypothetical protein